MAAANKTLKGDLVDIREAFSSAGKKLKVDTAKGIIYGVKVLGETSMNEGGRRYSEECRKQAIPLIEGKRVNVDHAEPGIRRSYRDRNGFLSNIREGGDGLYGDYHFNPHHPVTKQLLWDAENAPGNVGFSIDARGIKRPDPQGGFLIENLQLVRSVDLVADPATAVSLFESVDPAETVNLSEGELADKLALDERQQRRWRLLDMTQMLISKCLQDTLTGIDTKRQRMAAILDEWASEAQKLVNDVSTSNSPTGFPISTMKESVDMDLTKLTLAELQESRTDLIESIRKDDVAALASLQAQVAELKEQVTPLQEELAVYKAKEQKAAIEAEIQEALKSAKSPRGLTFDLTDKTQVSDHFLESLRTAPTPEARKTLIEDRLLLLESLAKPTVRDNQVVSSSREAALQEGLDSKVDPKQRVSAWTTRPLG